MDPRSWLLGALLLLLGLWGAWQLLRFGLVAWTIARLRYRPGALRLAEPGEFGAATAAMFEEAGRPWAALGFEPAANFAALAPFEGSVDWSPQQLWRRPEGPLFLLLQPSLTPQANAPCHASLCSMRADGRRLESLNGLGLLVLGELPGVDFDNAFAPEPEALLEHHRALLPAFLGGQALLDPPPQAWAEAMADSMAGYVPHLAKQGWLVPTGPETWRVAWRRILGFTWRQLRAQHQLARQAAAQAGQARPPAEAPPASLEAERRALARLLEQEAGLAKPRAWAQALAFWATAWLSWWALQATGVVQNPWEASWLLLALAFHEAGHWLAMRQLRYHDPTILFVPILGAFAHGQPPQGGRPQDRLWVSFAGPLPGLALGFWLLGLRALLPEGFLREELLAMGLTLVALNHLNLLPLWPLDGGRILDALLQAWGPRARQALELTSTLLLLIGAWATWEAPYLAGSLAFLAGLNLLAWPHRRRQEALTKALEGVEGEEARTLAALHRASQPPFAKLSFFSKVPLLKEALRQPTGALPRPWAWALAYLACLLAPPLLLSLLMLAKAVRAWAL